MPVFWTLVSTAVGDTTCLQGRTKGFEVLGAVGSIWKCRCGAGAGAGAGVDVGVDVGADVSCKGRCR